MGRSAGEGMVFHGMARDPLILAYHRGHLRSGQLARVQAAVTPIRDGVVEVLVEVNYLLYAPVFWTLARRFVFGLLCFGPSDMLRPGLGGACLSTGAGDEKSRRTFYVWWPTPADRYPRMRTTDLLS